ncbi:hypothetical protein [Amycolatopsis sp. cmx-4-54]|uniref:hypothetical protein n=1 Tax=Amycolatopsis sp. cmx-4-54 TaxID=2790936 RepID=UPI003978A633
MKAAFAAAGRIMPVKVRPQILAAVRATRSGLWPWMPTTRMSPRELGHRAVATAGK